MSTALFIYYTPSWQPLADIVLPIAARYCERWGYVPEFICEGADRLDCEMENRQPLGLWKMKELRRLMDKHGLIWVLDCDCLITNEEKKIPIPPMPYDILITQDTNGINAGSFIMYCNTTTKRFIDAVINDFDAPEEQTVMKRYIDGLYYVLPHPSINSYLYTEYLNDWNNKVGEGVPMPTHEQGLWQPGDFVLHLPGISLERRIEIFKQIKEQL